MVEPRRYSDRLSYRAVMTGVGVLAPIVVNIVMLAYTYGRVSEHVDGLEKRQATLENMLSAHIASAAMIMRPVPQSDAATTPATPKSSRPAPQQFLPGGDCPNTIPSAKSIREVKR